LFRLKTILIISAISTIGIRAANAQKIYWSDGGVRGIHRANLDGTDIEPVILSSTGGLALDLIEGRIYWAEQGTPSIWRANLDGSDPELVLPVEYGTPGRVALDQLHQRLYWRSGSAIWRANLDGSGIELIFYDAVFAILGFAVDPPSETFYWTIFASSFQAIMKGNLNGADSQQLITEGLWRPFSIALDTSNKRFYFVDMDVGISRANLDGSAVELIIEFGVPVELALDLTRDKIYWIDWRAGPYVRRANLDGSEPEELPIGDPYEPGAYLAVDPRVPGDCDISGTVSPFDNATFTGCLDGPDVHRAAGCPCADAEGDADVDLADVAVYQRMFNGS
jgi:hypothetical protein